MSKIKEILSQAYNQLDEYNKGGATQHILLWKAMGNTSYDKRKMCRNALPFDHRITKAISLTRKK